MILTFPIFMKASLTYVDVFFNREQKSLESFTDVLVSLQYAVHCL